LNNVCFIHSDKIYIDAYHSIKNNNDSQESAIVQNLQ
jgi:hypothetical protein